MATGQSILPMSMPADVASGATAPGPQNPQNARPDDQWMQLNLSQDDIDHTVKIITMYRDQWCTDRLARQRIWIKNVLFYRNIQVLDWYEGLNGTGGWVNSLAWYQG